MKHPGRGKIRRGNLAGGNGLFHTAKLIGFIVNAEGWFDARWPAAAAENSHAQGVEGAQMASGRHPGGKDPLTHLLGGLVGKGDGADLRRPDARSNQGGDPAGNHAGFAAARTGQHQQRTVPMSDRLPLRVR
jgi:hypothetical protein